MNTRSRIILAFSLVLFFAAPVVALSGCPKPQPAQDSGDVVVNGDVVTVTVTVDDAGAISLVDASDAAKKKGEAACVAACANLRKLGCPAGSEDAGQGCTSVCIHTVDSKLFNMNAPCLAAAKTVKEARACGTISTTTKCAGE